MWSPKASLSDFGPVFEKRKHKCTLGTERTLSNLQECAKKKRKRKEHKTTPQRRARVFILIRGFFWPH